MLCIYLPVLQTTTHASVSANKTSHRMATALFWDITQQVVLIHYRRFGTNFWIHLQGPKGTTRRVTAQKNAVIFFAKEALNHASNWTLAIWRLDPFLKKLEPFNVEGKRRMERVVKSEVLFFLCVAKLWELLDAIKSPFTYSTKMICLWVFNTVLLVGM